MTGTVLERIESDVYDWLIGLEELLPPRYPEYEEDLKYAKRLVKDIKEWQKDYERG